MEDVTRLKKRFKGRGEVRGLIFTRIRQAHDAIIYEVNTGDSICYEVFERRINRRFGCESYPTSKAFGIWAWTTHDFDRAMQIFRALALK